MLRILRYTFQHIFRNFSHSILVVLIIGLAILFVQLFVLISLASHATLKFFENQPNLLVFFRDETSPDQILQIKNELQKDPLIETIDYISKEQAVEIYKERHQDEPELLEFVTADILPASLEISGLDIGYLATIATQFQNNQFVEEVIFQRDLVQELQQFTDAIRVASLAVAGVSTLIAVMIVLIVVSNNITTSAREIEIMQLVGASGSFISLPFVIASIFLTFLGSLLATVTMSWIVPHLENFIFNFIAPIRLPAHLGSMSLLHPSWLPAFASFSLLADLWLWTFVVGTILTSLISFITVWRKFNR